jgi:heme/copper-type cytochrome/quinol oxidase subunit 2
MLLFLLGFTVLLIVVFWFYLLPALAAAQNATPEQRAKLSAVAMLVLMVVLFVLAMGLLMILRIGRYFFPRADAEPTVGKTEYVDAWAESARRMPTPAPEDESKDQSAGG